MRLSCVRSLKLYDTLLFLNIVWGIMTENTSKHFIFFSLIKNSFWSTVKHHATSVHRRDGHNCVGACAQHVTLFSCCFRGCTAYCTKWICFAPSAWHLVSVLGAIMSTQPCLPECDHVSSRGNLGWIFKIRQRLCAHALTQFC